MSDRLCLGCMSHLEEDQVCTCGFDENSYEVPPHHLVPGTVLQGRYVIGKVLGEGGFGITYVGRDNVLDMKIAVKEFYMTGYVNRNNAASDTISVSIGEYAEQFDKNKEKFLKEARVLAKFATEKGIVGIHDFFEANNTAYIIMDFITGETLKERVKREGRLTEETTFDLLAPILKSLAVVHDNNLIHRDISPDNIMITASGDANLLDFGAAREVSQNDIKSLSVILKPGFAPEEQYRSKGVQGPWTDIYALCATMYCCLTGTVPEDSMERMFEDQLKPPHEVAEGISIATSMVIMKGMAVRQQDRYQTIAELQEDIARARSNPQNGKIGSAYPEVGGQTVLADVNSVQRTAVDGGATVYADASYFNGNTNTGDYGATVYADSIADYQRTGQQPGRPGPGPQAGPRGQMPQGPRTGQQPGRPGPGPQAGPRGQMPQGPRTGQQPGRPVPGPNAGPRGPMPQGARTGQQPGRPGPQAGPNVGRTMYNPQGPRTGQQPGRLGPQAGPNAGRTMYNPQGPRAGQQPGRPGPQGPRTSMQPGRPGPGPQAGPNTGRTMYNPQGPRGPMPQNGPRTGQQPGRPGPGPNAGRTMYNPQGPRGPMPQNGPRTGQQSGRPVPGPQGSRGPMPQADPRASQKFNANANQAPQFHAGGSSKPQWMNPVPGENGSQFKNMNPVPTSYKDGKGSNK